MSRLSNTAQGPDINSKEAVKHITSGINRLIAGASLEFKSTALCWWLDEHALISDDVHYGQFLEHEAFDDVVTKAVEESRTNREYLYEIWQSIGPSFKSYWLNRLSSAQRQGLLVKAFSHIVDTPDAERFRKFLLDFNCDSLNLDGGRPVINLINLMTSPENRQSMDVPSEIMNSVFNGWASANNAGGIIEAHMTQYLIDLKWHCRFSRCVIGTRILVSLFGFWHDVAGPYLAQKGSVGLEETPESPIKPGSKSKKSKKKKKKSNHRGQKAKSDYQMRKKENRACNEDYDSDDSFVQAQNEFIRESKSSDTSSRVSEIEEPVQEEAAFFEFIGPVVEAGQPLKSEIIDAIEKSFPKPIESGPIESILAVQSVKSDEPTDSRMNFELFTSLGTDDSNYEPQPFEEAIELVNEALESPEAPFKLYGATSVAANHEASSVNAQNKEVPELLAETNDQHIVDVTPPSTPIMGLSPAVHILDENQAELENDKISLNDNSDTSFDRCTFVDQDTEEDYVMVGMKSPPVFENGSSIVEVDSVPTIIETFSGDVGIGNQVNFIPGTEPPRSLLISQLALCDNSNTVKPKKKSRNKRKNKIQLKAVVTPSVETKSVLGTPIIVSNSSCLTENLNLSTRDSIEDKKADNSQASASPAVVFIEDINELVAAVNACVFENIEEVSVEDRSIITEVFNVAFTDDTSITLRFPGKDTATIEAGRSACIKAPEAVIQQVVEVVEEYSKNVEVSWPVDVLELQSPENSIVEDLSEVVFRDIPSEDIVQGREDLLSVPESVSGEQLLKREYSMDILHVYKSSISALEYEFIEPMNNAVIINESFQTMMKKTSSILSDDNTPDVSVTSTQGTPLLFDPCALYFKEMPISPHSSGQTTPIQDGKNLENVVRVLLSRPVDSGFHGQYQDNMWNRGHYGKYEKYKKQQHKHHKKKKQQHHQKQQQTSSQQYTHQNPADQTAVNTPRLMEDPATQRQVAMVKHREEMRFCTESVPFEAVSNGTEYQPCHEGARFYNRPDTGRTTGYYGYAKVPEDLLIFVKNDKKVVILGDLIFNCEACGAKITHQDSIICPRCGPNTSVRFCDDRCRYACGRHWAKCCIGSHNFETDVVARPFYFGPQRLRENHPGPDMNQYRYWHAMLKHDYPGIDYYIFRQEDMVKHKGPIVLRGVVFGDQNLRNRFEAVYRMAFYTPYETYLVGILYRIVRFWLSENGWAGVTSERLMAQFSMEFDIGFTNGAGLVDPPAAALSEIEWLQLEVYLSKSLLGDGFAGVKPVLRKFPLVGKEPRVPCYLAERFVEGAVTILDC